MRLSDAFKEYVMYLFEGRRAEAREVLMRAHDRGNPACKLLQYVIWPAMEEVEKLYRGHHISLLQEHIATRINRMVADQLAGFLGQKPRSGLRIIVTCGDGEVEELGAQITADLFQANGWAVWFPGSGVPCDEILQLIGKAKPDLLCIYGAQPAGVPNIKKLIDMVRGVGVCEDMQIMVAGGVFNRAEGLAAEIKADLFAANIEEALKTTAEHPVRVPVPDVPQPGRRRKRRQSAAHAAAIRKAKVALGI